MTVPTSVKEKIQKLFSLSTSPSQNEASTALLMAHALLKKYNLTREEITSLKETTLDEKIYSTGKKERTWKTILLSYLAEFNFCQLIKLLNAETSSYAYQIVGKEINILSVNLMADYIFSAISRLVKKIERTEKENFKRGFVMGIIEQIEAQKKKEISECTDLIISTKKEFEDYMKEKEVKEKAISLFNEITSGLIQGFEKGRNLPLKQQIGNKEEGDYLSLDN